MRSICMLPALSGLIAAFTFATSASADLIAVSTGAKIAGGGNLWTTPSGIPGGYSGLGFAGDGGGIGYGIGWYGELRVIEFTGVEIGVAYDNSSLWRNVTINGIVETREKVSASNLRVPILFKGILPVGFGRLWLGIGPEYVKPLSTSGSVEITSNRNLVSNADQVENSLKTRTADSWMLTTALGLAIHLPPMFEIPIELRIAKNLSQPDPWLERAELNLAANTYAIQVQNSWDFRLLAGFGVRF